MTTTSGWNSLGIDMTRGPGRDVHNSEQESLHPTVTRQVTEYVAAEPPMPGEACLTCGHAAPITLAWPGGLVYHSTTRELRARGTPIRLTHIETGIVHVLAMAAGALVPSEAIIAVVWPPNWYNGFPGGDHCIRVHLSRIRKKLSAAGYDGWIITVPRTGLRTIAPLAGEVQ